MKKLLEKFSAFVEITYVAGSRRLEEQVRPMDVNVMKEMLERKSN